MITDADTKKLVRAFKEVFPTKDDIKDQFKDQKDQILDAVDGKLAIQKQEILEDVDSKLDSKLAKQKIEIVKDVAEYISNTIVPMFDERDKKISRIEKKLNLPPLAD